jgi:hypothetical protein
MAITVINSMSENPRMESLRKVKFNGFISSIWLNHCHRYKI